MKKLFVILILAGLLVFGFNAAAQEDGSGAASLDVDITGAELGVSEPTILPTSPLYFLKNVSRFFQSALTFNPVKEADLSLKFANEKLLEAKKLARREEISEGVLKNALENYNREMERIREWLETMTGKTPAVEIFLDKLIDSGIKQQKILDKISGDFQPAKEAVEQTKERSLETIAAIPLKIETAEEFGQRLERIITRQTGSHFKDFKNLEVLKEVELKVPEQAKAAIKQARENTLSRFQQTLTDLTEDEKIEFENYLKEIPGSLPRQIQILNDLRQTAVTGPVKEFSEKIQKQTIDRLQARIQEKIKQETGAETANGITAEKARQMIEQTNEAMNKLQKVIEANAAKAEDFPAVFRLRENARKHLGDARNALENGKFEEAWGLSNAALQNVQNALRVFEIKPEAILRPVESPPATQILRPTESPSTTTATKPIPEAQFCIQLWQPVCGTDGKTYSNSCFARIAGTKIAHEGECGKKEQSRERIFNSTEQYCAKSNTRERLSLSEAKQIALTSACANEGKLQKTYSCNETTGTWWIDLDIQKPGCSPACVINVVDRQAEINWRCTGLIVPPTLAPSSR